MNIILCGFKGSGKTHFGRLLAERLGLEFVDTDKLLEERFSQSCRALMKSIGRENFSAHEAEVVTLLRGVKNCVIALGGGTLLHPQNASLVSELGRVIYLSLDKELLKKQMLRHPLPAFIDPQDPDASFEAMYLERKPLYEKFSTAKVDLASATEQEILQQLEKIYGK